MAPGRNATASAIAKERVVTRKELRDEIGDDGEMAPFNWEDAAESDACREYSESDEYYEEAE